MRFDNIVLITSKVSRLPVAFERLKLFVHAVLKKLRYCNTTVGVVFVSDAKIKRLNQRHLRHSYATDVLAFQGQGDYLGEVIISPQRARIQAKRFGASFEEELMRYVCHGILHLSGYADKTRREMNQMRKMEDQLLKLTPRKKRA